MRPYASTSEEAMDDSSGTDIEALHFRWSNLVASSSILIKICSFSVLETGFGRKGRHNFSMLSPVVSVNPDLK